MNGIKRIHGRIRGRVQGVGFRYFVLRQAQGLGLRGYVRNEPDGSVSVEAQGAAADVEAFYHALRRGPLLAGVERVDLTEMSLVKDEESFSIRH